MLIHLQFCAPPHAEVKQKVGREGERNEEYRGKTRKVTGFFCNYHLCITMTGTEFSISLRWFSSH